MVVARPPLKRVRMALYPRAGRPVRRLVRPVLLVHPVKQAGDGAPAPAVLTLPLVLLVRVWKLGLVLPLPPLRLLLSQLLRAPFRNVRSPLAQLFVLKIKELAFVILALVFPRLLVLTSVQVRRV